MSEQPQQNIPSIRLVPLANGLHWLKSGYAMFKAYPLMWIVLFMIYFGIIFPVSGIPGIGPIIGTLLAPVFAAGMMLGCRDIDHNKPLEINHVFAGFKKNTVQLISLGGFYMVGILFVSMFFATGLDQSMVEAIAKSGTVSPAQMEALSTPLLKATFMLIPVMMAYWFAPALVALHDLTAVQAIKLSFKACLRNIVPFILYLVAVALIFIVLMQLMFLVSGLGPIGAIVLALAFCGIMPLMMTSLFASYRDIFLHQ